MTRVAQWATGTTGRLALRAIIDAPTLELVGVRVYDPGKVKVDAGVLAGRPATGVLATDDNARLVRARPDVVLYMGAVEKHPDDCFADVANLLMAGIDVIANPCPGGAYFGSRIGCNTSSNAVVSGDNYPRLTNYIAQTLNAGMGIYVGKLQSPSVRAQAAATLTAFLDGMWQEGMIGDVSDASKTPFSIQLDTGNNPASRVALGYLQADIRVTYLSVITRLLLNVEGGQSVSVTVASSTPQ